MLNRKFIDLLIFNIFDNILFHRSHPSVFILSFESFNLQSKMKKMGCRHTASCHCQQPTMNDRDIRLLIVQCGNAGKDFSFQILERGASAG